MKQLVRTLEAGGAERGRGVSEGCRRAQNMGPMARASRACCSFEISSSFSLMSSIVSIAAESRCFIAFVSVRCARRALRGARPCAREDSRSSAPPHWQCTLYSYRRWHCQLQCKLQCNCKWLPVYF